MPDDPLPHATRVLVVGGGPVGLVVSGLLSQQGISHLLVERRRETQRAPAAHVVRRAPMQVLSRLGVADEVRRTAPPLALDFITWCVTLGGAEVGRLDLRPPDPATGTRPPEPWTHCPQNRLEPILLRHAARQPEACIALGAECVEIAQTDACVSARIRRDDGREQRVEAGWAIAADGARSPVRRALGIDMPGHGPLGRFRMVHFAADLTPWVRERPGPIFWILNPESSGCLIVHDPARSHVFMLPMLGADDDVESVPQRLAAALGVPAEAEILSIDSWSPHVQVASRYRAGRVFLVGDAAHRFPPTGGLGLNTGILEAENLVSKLARVEAARAPAALLDAYAAECRPAALANAAASFENMKTLGEISRVLGAWPDRASLEERLATLTEAEHALLQAAIEAQRDHFLFDGHPPEPVRESEMAPAAAPI